MATLISLDGRLLRPAEARISVFDRGFLYGDSIYEVLRTYGGRLFEEGAHLDRLSRSAELIGLSVPVSRGTLLARSARLLRAAGNGETYLRIVITRGEGELGLDPALARGAQVLLLARALRTPPPELYRDGVKVSIVEASRLPSDAVDPAAKTGNYLASVLALREARLRGGHEALRLDALGQVSEGSSSNVFAWLDGRLVTPPVRGILAGVTRRVVLSLANALGIPAVEAPLTRGDLLRAAELFLTSTTRELLPVTSVDDARVGDGRPGPTTLKLLAAFRLRAAQV